VWLIFDFNFWLDLKAVATDVNAAANDGLENVEKEVATFLAQVSYFYLFIYLKQQTLNSPLDKNL
jgi:hypothetical protein